MINFEIIEHLIKENKLDEAIDLLAEKREEINDSTSKMKIHLLTGQIFHKQHKWGEMINQYSLVLEIDPENSIAQTGIQIAQNILGFHNPDMFNP